MTSKKIQTEKKASMGLLSGIRSYALTGVLVTAPVVITIYILHALVTTLDQFLVRIVPPVYRPETWLGLHIPGTGLIAGLILVVVVGIIARNFLGKYLVSWSENIMYSIPGVRSVYGAIKQILDTVATKKSEAFREVVLVEYPRKNIWCIAFVTGKTKGHVQQVVDEDLTNIFLPTTPNPTSGFLLFVPKKDLIKLNMTVDQGLKMVISGGIITPSAAEGKAALKKEKIEPKITLKSE